MAMRPGLLLRRRRSGGGALPGLVALVALLLPPVAAAQVPVGQDTVEADTLRVLPHEGITVRALRAPLSLEALPFAVTVRMMEDRPPAAGLTLAGALRAVPGLQVHSRYNDALGERIVVRGFGARAQFGIRGVHVLVDGIPATMPDGQTTLNHLDMAFLERAEALRGPAAAAFGNAAGGVLLLSTTAPPDSPLRPAASAVRGSDGLIRLRGTAGAGDGRTGWIGSVSREWRDGYRPHAGTDRWQLTGRFDTPLAGGFLRVVTHGVAYDADNPGSLTPDQYLADPHQAQAFNVVQRTGEEGRHGQVGATWERFVGSTAVEATAYGLARSLENPIPPAIIDLDRRAGGARVLVRGEGDGRDAVGWAAGLDAAVLGDDRLNHRNEEGARGDRTLDQSERVVNLAGHAQALVPLLDRVGLFLAARYDRVTFSADDRMVTATDPDDSGRRAMDAISPAAGLRIDVARNVSILANVSTAFETPTTTELVNRPDGAGGFNSALEPQRTVSWEIGARATPLRAVRLEATGYHARIEDALVPFEVESAPGRQYFRNAASAVHTGVELLAELWTRRIDMLAAFARTDAAFGSYRTADRSFDGLAVPGVRPWTAGLDVVARPTGRLTVGAGYEAAGEMAVDDANETYAPGYGLFGLSASLPVHAGALAFRVHAGIDNLLDETWVASIVPNAFGQRFFEPGPGRSFYMGLELSGRADR